MTETMLIRALIKARIRLQLCGKSAGCQPYVNSQKKTTFKIANCTLIAEKKKYIYFKRP